MKKLFLLLALAGCMVACEENKVDNSGQAAKDLGFVIELTHQTPNSLTFDIKPSDEYWTYYWNWADKSFYDENYPDLEQYAEAMIAQEYEGHDFMYDLANNKLDFGEQKDLTIEDLTPNTKYAVRAFFFDQDWKLVGKVHESVFTTLEEFEQPE